MGRRAFEWRERAAGERCGLPGEAFQNLEKQLSGVFVFGLGGVGGDEAIE